MYGNNNKLILKILDIPLPNEKGRLEMFRINLKSVSVSDDVNWEKLVSVTEGYSGADISNVCREASLMQMRRRLMSGASGDIMELINNPDLQKDLEAPITMEDLILATTNISKSVSKSDLERYDKWTEEFKSS